VNNQQGDNNTNSTVADPTTTSTNTIAPADTSSSTDTVDDSDSNTVEARSVGEVLKELFIRALSA